MKDVYEKSLRMRLRFTLGDRHDLTLENLWELPLRGNNGYNLDTLAQDLDERRRQSLELSFVNEKTTSKNQELAQEMFDVVKHIIDRKLEDEVEAQKQVEIQNERRLLQEILERKKLDELNNKSIDEIDQMLKDLEN